MNDVSGTRAARPGNAKTGLADALRDRTRSLHVQAERSGIVQDVLRGRVTREAYALYLRNLVPAYEQLELGLRARGRHVALDGIAREEIYRVPALASDLDRLHGAGWWTSMPCVPTAARYAEQIARAAEGDGTRLIAHAYTRYLGDLNGGRVLARILAKSLDLDAGALGFYAFPGIVDLDDFKAHYRAQFDRAGRALDAWTDVLDEADAAFRLNIDVSLEVQTAALRAAAARSSIEM